MATQKTATVFLRVWWRLFLLILGSCISATQRTLSTGLLLCLDRHIQSLVNSRKQERRGGRGGAGTRFNSAVSHQSARLSDWRGETQAAKETGPWFVQGQQQWFETILFADTSFMLLGCQLSDFGRFMAGSRSACVCAAMSGGRGGQRCYWGDSDPCPLWLSSAALCLVLVNLLVHFSFHMLLKELKQKVKQQVVKRLLGTA